MDYWTLGMVLSLRKKDGKSDVMDDMRGVHLLAFVRQWYASLLLPSLQELASRILPDEQEGFRPGGRVYASYLALFALMENYRLRGKRLFVCFLDVAKGFPSVRRELLWSRLKEAGASDDLIRALYTLYLDAKGTVRASSGFGEVFGINLGTREGGGTESPLLYSLYVFDLVQRLGSLDLDGEPVILDGKKIRVLQFANDVALLATSEEDLDRLLHE